MTVSNSTNRVSYSGNGTLTTFAYSFKIFDQDDLTVILRASNGTETVQTITTNYTVTGVGSASGGNVVFGTAPASGVTVVILREMDLEQGLDLVANDPFPAGSLEDSLDKLTFMVQQHDEQLGRAIKASRTNVLSGSEFVISASDRANKVFSFDGSGDLAVTQELGTFQGDWATATAYVVRDIVKDTSTNNIFIVNTAHTSSGAQPLTTNANSAKYDLIVDAASAATSATNAAASETASQTAQTASEAAKAAAETAQAAAETAETNAETAEANAETAQAAAEAAQSSAETVYDNFDDRYLGSKSSDPTLDNDGDALIDGALYFDTTNNVTKVYDLGTTSWLRTTPTTSDQTKINTVSGIQANVNTVAGVSSDVTTVAGVSANVTTVATDIANVNTNATNITSINTNATNITDIQNANANAASALASKNAAETAETNAETAETNAETAETNAAASASSASASASSASTSSSTATTQAGVATTKAGEAATSATASANSATASEAAKDAALAALDNFDDRYLGAKASDPTVDNDGNALVSGALYFNTTDDVMKVYEGSQWVAAYASLSGALLVANNLSDLASASAGRTNLGLGTAATAAATDFVAVTGDSMTGNLSFGDNDKAIFGAGSDLQIYHDGDNSRITESGTGNLKLQADNFYVLNAAGNATSFESVAGVATLFYSNSPKLATTSSGCDINGTLTSDGLTLSNADAPTIEVTDTTNTTTTVLKSGNNTGVIGTTTAHDLDIRSNNTDRLTVLSNGDISFYEDTGTTPKFFWDSSAEGLSIRTTSNPNSSPLYIRCATDDNIRIQQETHAAIQAVNDAANAFTELKLDGSTLLLNSQSGGNLLVGKTSTSSTTAGGNIFGGLGSFVRDGNTPLSLNRRTNDGEIVSFAAQDSVVGSIGNASTNLIVEATSSNRSGLSFGGSITPRRGGANSDSAVDLGTGSYRFKDLYLSGTANAANFNTTSDATLKTNVETLSGSLDAVTSLRGVSFDWLENGGSEIGVIAQEVEAVLPDVVSTNDEGIKSVKYGNMVAVLIEAIKEQQLRIEALEAKLGD